MTSQSTPSSPIGDDAAEHFVDAYDDSAEAQPASMSDPDLLRAYQRTNGEPGDPEADALLAEIDRRNLDI